VSLVKLALLTVLIDRDATVRIPTTVYEYELPVLEEIHGEQSVSVVDSRDVSVDITAADAYAQLMRKYPQHTEAVKVIYRNPKALARESGLPYAVGDDEAARFQQSSVVIHDAPADATVEDDPVTEPADAGAALRADARAKAQAAK
jgi:hypothetical protein